MGTVANVVVGAVNVKIADYPEALPTVTSSVTWGANWDDLPFITKAGVKAKFMIETKSVEAFMESAPIKEGIIKSGAESVTIQLLESDQTALAFAFPATELTDTTLWLTHGDLASPKQFALGIETALGVWVFPCIQPRGEPEIVISDESENIIEVTFTCLVDANGKSWYVKDFTA